MTAQANMICSSCQTFQPRAVKCSTCGVIVQKLVKPEPSRRPKPTVSVAGEPPMMNKRLLLFIAIPVIGFMLLSGGDNTSDTSDAKSEVGTQDKAKKSSPTDQLAKIHPGAAAQMRTNNTRAKLHGLRTMLYQYTMEGTEPPTNAEELQVLVDRRYLSQSDITDDWGNKFVYKMKWGKETRWGKEYEITVHSKGPDGRSGTRDDIGMP